MSSLGHLSTNAITARLYEIRKAERGLLVDFLRHLAELERRDEIRALGFPSTFAFCTDHLGLNRGSAYRRLTAARLLARFPVIADYLTDGRLCLTTLAELKNVLEPERLIEILDRAAGRTEEEVQRLVAALQPRPAPRDLLRRLPAPRIESGFTHRRNSVEEKQVDAGNASPTQAVVANTGPVEAAVLPLFPADSPRRPATVEPIAAELHVLRMTVSAKFVADLEEVRNELSHKVPAGRLEEVIQECLNVTLAVYRKRHRGAGRATSLEAPPEGSRHIPAAIRHAVWKRDGGRCTFVGRTGRSCGSRYQVEFHHLDPFGKQGATTVENLTLRCHAHNQYAAEQDYGREHMRRARS